jgi:cyclopropane fatty-acyl-phospholipid synthase-like methyltransferase
LTVLDGSSEMLALNRGRLGELASRVEYQEMDLFEWQPPRRGDGLVFCFWISHVPRDRLDTFFSTCREALVQDGTMFFLDGQRVDQTTASDQVLPEAHSEVMVRRLNDGREFRIVKNFYTPEELIERAAVAGFELEVHHTANYFQFGVGRAR